MKGAFIAIEDKRFFEHGGIDWIRTSHAVRDYLVHGNASFGGSTLTQQLVKNLTGDSERSISRKAAELVRAARLEERHTKEEILEEYLNIVNLAENCYGVHTAANAYFSKQPSELTPAEAATLAAITNNPCKYDPIKHPEANRSRRDLILAQMHEQGMLTDEVYQHAVFEDCELRVDRSVMSGRVNSWYADVVIEDVIAALVREKGMKPAEASRLVYCGGLRIEVCMEPRLQEILEAYYRNQGNFPVTAEGKRAQSGMIIADPKSGDILALVGAVGEKNSNRVQNFATISCRPSGSVIKPLSVYAPALERGIITYATVFDDIPHSYRKSGAPWPRNSPNIYRGLTTVNDALTHSVNTVSVSVLERLGAHASLAFLQNELGFHSLSKSDLGAAALALGQQQNGVTLREIVAGYTPIAGDGNFKSLRSFTGVYDTKGELLLENGRSDKRVLSPENAAVLTMMLRHAVQNGTGRALTLKESVDVAGKTGTSGKGCDKWFVGYTPELLAGVWFGMEYPEPLTGISGNPALNIFDAVMKEAVLSKGITQRQFETPEGVVAVRVCKDSGCLPSEICNLDPRGDRTEIGYFKRGTEPHVRCTCHTLVDYCDTGGVSCENCPSEHRHAVALIRVSRDFPRQIHVLDAAYTCTETAPAKEPNFTSNTPYYLQNENSNRFVGIGMEEIPFNRACPGHADEDFWERRFVA